MKHIRFLDRSTPPHLITLVIATATNALAMNIFLPSLPAIARHFDADYAIVQFIVTLYLSATAILQLGIGPASDRFGRRPVMLACFTIFLIGSVGVLLAPTIETLLAARVLQAFSAGGMVLARAIVRDTVATDEAASRIGYVTMGMAVVPMFGPAIGGFLDELYGWKAAFLVTLGFGLMAFLILYFDLGETNKSPSNSIKGQLRGYGALLRSGKFWGYTLTAAFSAGSFFAFLGGGPYVATEMLVLSPSQYGLYFAMMSAGYMTGNFLSGRFSRRFGVNAMTLAGTIAALLGVIAALLFMTLGYFSPVSFFAPLAFIGVGNGMTMPNANAGIVSVHLNLAGSASGLGGALQIGGGAALAAIAGSLLTPTSGPWPLLFVMLFSCAAALVPAIFIMMSERGGND